jgi:hypothetical protein
MEILGERNIDEELGALVYTATNFSAFEVPFDKLRDEYGELSEGRKNCLVNAGRWLRSRIDVFDATNASDVSEVSDESLETHLPGFYARTKADEKGVDFDLFVREARLIAGGYSPLKDNWIFAMREVIDYDFRASC